MDASARQASSVNTIAHAAGSKRHLRVNEPSQERSASAAAAAAASCEKCACSAVKNGFAAFAWPVMTHRRWLPQGRSCPLHFPTLYS